MSDVLALALGNLVSPPILFFALGLAAALARSDLDVPEPVGKALALYLMLAIGFKGGAELAIAGLSVHTVAILAGAAALSLLMPFAAYPLLRVFVGVEPVTAASVAAHYGSISVVTFVTATELLRQAGVAYEGAIVAGMALMETPAIISALIIARMAGGSGGAGAAAPLPVVLREVAANGSVLLLVGAFLIGWASGPPGREALAPFIEAPFRGVLCLFLLDMGLVAARRGAAGFRAVTPRALAFGLAMPLIGAVFGLAMGEALGLSVGGHALLAVLAASASYIAVPAAMRLALPAANATLAIMLSLCVTFPFNIVVGIPLYLAAARALG